MLIAISGTPGTGKTAVAKILSRKLKAKTLTVDFLVKKYNIRASYDKKRKTKIIDEKKLANAAKQEAKKYRVAVFEGHLSHFAAADSTIILRTSPQELERRMKKKKWNKKKIRENVEAESVGIISREAGGMEIDTTSKTPKNVAQLILKLLNNYPMQRKYLKKIDWSENYAKYLKRK